MGDRIKPVISDQELFHVHTFRCRHAEEIPDRAYVEKALELGAKGIWFTDHCPFPGDLFKREHRMLYKELPELRHIYSGKTRCNIKLPGLRNFYTDILTKLLISLRGTYWVGCLSRGLT